MRALVSHGPENVSVDEGPDATIEAPTDALIRITTTLTTGYHGTELADVGIGDSVAATDPAKQGRFDIDFGTFFFKGLSMGTGQANVKQYNRQLRNLIHQGRLSPGVIVSHQLDLDEAAEGYQHFDDRDKGWTKVQLHP